jgi:hypothetical protein
MDPIMCLKKSQDNFHSITNELHAAAIALPSNIGINGVVRIELGSCCGIEGTEFEVWIWIYNTTTLVFSSKNGFL